MPWANAVTSPQMDDIDAMFSEMLGEMDLLAKVSYRYRYQHQHASFHTSANNNNKNNNIYLNKSSTQQNTI